MGLDEVPPFHQLLTIRDAVIYAERRGHSYPRMSVNHDLLSGRLRAGIDAWMIGNRWYVSPQAVERRMREREAARLEKQGGVQEVG